MVLRNPKDMIINAAIIEKHPIIKYILLYILFGCSGELDLLYAFSPILYNEPQILSLSLSK